MAVYTFNKSERLTNKKVFEGLFSKGKSFAESPFRFVWMELSSASSHPAQLGISVPKKAFAKAVVRNKLKRRIREAYRKNKHLLYEELKKKNLHIALMVIYTAKEEHSYSGIEKKMVISLHKLIGSIK